ncbi:hypothetical protein B0H16DRAFT_1464484 [Mycena metata]|uniref:DNA polymerase n=1 Tax=Mycena metata TaxID=1033252 RepID=A0AAD7IEH9_9AGAR|nr:hypothetical protein B0H16DRAFT_1464484 [Mycena metata]
MPCRAYEVRLKVPFDVGLAGDLLPFLHLSAFSPFYRERDSGARFLGLLVLIPLQLKVPEVPTTKAGSQNPRPGFRDLNEKKGWAYSAESKGPNDAILNMLKSNKEDEEKQPNKNVYKIRAFTSAIRVIDALDRPLRSATEAKSTDASQLKGIGPGIFRRLQDFFETSGSAEELDSKILDQLKQERAARLVLEQVPGIGPVKARELVAAGCTTLEQLRTPQYMDMLTSIQRTGVTYFHHIEERVTREEAEVVAQKIREVISPKYEVIIGGSYRRGATTSSDIDLIILHPDHVHVPFPSPPDPALVLPTPKKSKSKSRKGNGNGGPSSLLQADLIPVLEKRGILASTLSSGELKWQGIALLPSADAAVWGERQRQIDAIENGDGVYRRMDLNLVAQKSRGAALLSLTGDTDFIRDLRIRAKKIGLHLSEFGLWRWNAEERDSDRDPQSSSSEDEGEGRGFWELVRAETEEEVLAELGMDYIEPTKRNYASLMKGGSTKGRKR